MDEDRKFPMHEVSGVYQCPNCLQWMSNRVESVAMHARECPGKPVPVYPATGHYTCPGCGAILNADADNIMAHDETCPAMKALLENLPPLPEPGQGRKYDQKKPRFSLLPKGTVEEVVKVLTVGAIKYEDNNWQKVPEARERYYNAAMRHIEAWWGGEPLDSETGLHHLAHATCCCLFLMWFDKP